MPKLSKKPAKKMTPSKGSRPVLYSEVVIEKFDGDHLLTAEKAKELLGWRELEKGSDEEFLLTDLHDKPIVCDNNTRNRPFSSSLSRVWESSILQKRWKLNGESIIIGKTGLDLSGQHRLVGLVLAEQEWNVCEEWKQYWPDSPPAIPAIVVYGIEEDAETIDTLDTGKPRSFADTLCHYPAFEKMKTSERNKHARVCSYAVKALWMRTGAGEGAFANRQTHADMKDFLDRHSSLVAAVKYVLTEEGKDGKLSRLLSLGYFSGLLYLMASCGSEPNDYYGDKSTRLAHERTEKELSWSFKDKAEAYITCLAGRAKEVEAVIKTLSQLTKDANLQERIAIIVKGWSAYSSTGKVTLDDVELSYNVDGDVKILDEKPTIGGIDLTTADSPSYEPSEEEIARQAEEIRNEKENGKKDIKPIPAKKSSKKSKQASTSSGNLSLDDLVLGSLYWVRSHNGTIWQGKLDDIDRKTDQAKLIVQHGHKGAGMRFIVSVASVLGTEQPEPVGD